MAETAMPNYNIAEENNTIMTAPSCAPPTTKQATTTSVPIQSAVATKKEKDGSCIMNTPEVLNTLFASLLSQCNYEVVIKSHEDKRCFVDIDAFPASAADFSARRICEETEECQK